MASLATAAGRLWRAISPRSEEPDSCGDANPNASPLATSPPRACLSTNPQVGSHTPRKEPAGRRDDELSSEITLPLPHTPPRTMEVDLLFRRETPPPPALPATVPIDRKGAGTAASVSPSLPRASCVLAEAERRACGGCHRRLALPKDGVPYEEQGLVAGRPHKMPFIVCSPDGTLRVSPAAAQELSKREGNATGVRVLSVFGGPKSGKSTLIERGFFGLGQENDDPDHVPAGAAGVKDAGRTGQEMAVDGGRDRSPSKSPSKAQPRNLESPAASKAVVMWLWSEPVRARQTFTDKPDRFGGQGSSVPSNVSVSSFSSGRVASCSAVVGGQWSLGSQQRAATDGASSCAPIEELVEITILESGSCSTMDDSVVLSLCILLSSQLVYNGVDLLDAACIQNLTALRDLPKHINTRGDSGTEDGIAFREYFPKLSWLLRDSDAQLIDERRHPISPSAYLERALKVRGFSEEAEEKNMVRKMIASFFPEQDCHVLPTPAAIPGLPLGERFLKKLEGVRDGILCSIPVKSVMGRQVDGAMLHDLAQAYIADVNSGLPLCIPRACDSMSVLRCELALRRALESYKAEREVLRGSLPTSDASILQWQGEVTLRAHKVLDSKAVTDVDHLRAQLDASLLQLHSEVVRENEEASRVKATALLEALYADCEERLRTCEITSLEAYEKEREKVRKEFDSKTSDLAQYACRMTMLEFMENRLVRFSQMILSTAARQQHVSSSESPASISSPACVSKTHVPVCRGTPPSGTQPLPRTPKTSSGAPLPRSPRLPNAFAPGNAPGAAEGKWVKREVLEHVKRKAKADLVDLENELMTVIMAMEDQIKCEGQGAEHEEQEHMTKCAAPAELPEDSTAGSPSEETSPIFLPKSRQKLQRAAPPPPADSPLGLQAAMACQRSEDALDAGMEAAASDAALRCVGTGDIDHDDDDRHDTSEVLPVALEAALDAAVEESDGPWAAAVSAAMTAAQDEDDEAWHVALEAALEVATAQAVSSNVFSFREKVLATRSRSRSPDGQLEWTSLTGAQQLSARDNDLVGEGTRVAPSDSENVAPQISRITPKLASKSPLVMEQPCRSGQKSTLLTADGTRAEADEAACRLVEAEIIRRFISDASPIECRRTPRTPTGAGLTSAPVFCASQPTSAMPTESPVEAAPEADDTVSVHVQQPTRAQRRVAPPLAASGPRSCVQASGQEAVQSADSHTYTSNHLTDLAIRTASSPSESASHQPLSWQISSPAPHAGMPRCGAIVTAPPVTFVNSPRVSPLKTCVATPSPRKGVRCAAVEPRLASDSNHAPTNWLALSRDVSHSAFDDAGGGSVAVAASSEDAKSPVSAASPSPLAAMAPVPPVVSYCGHLPPQQQRQLQLTKQAMEKPSPRVPSLLPRAGQSMAPISSRPGTRRPLGDGAAPPAPTLLEAAGPSPLNPAHQSACSDAGVITESQMQDELTSADTADAAACVPPLQGQLFLDGVELIVPDPALGLLNCACLRKVSVRPPAADGRAGGQDSFVDVCIDCGAVHAQQTDGRM